jgi:hypothetical protein
MQDTRSGSNGRSFFENSGSSNRDNVLRNLVVLYSLFITLINTFRLPNDWAEAHWLIGYNLGVYKRGLVGGVVSGLFSPQKAQYAELFIIVCSCLLTLIALLIVYRIILKVPPVIALGIATSPIITMWAHLTGYFDLPLFIIIFLVIYLVKKERYWPSSALLMIGLLIHESIAPLGFPVVFFAVIYYNLIAVETVNFHALKQVFFKLCKVFLPPAVGFCFIILMVGNHDSKSEIMSQLNAYGFATGRSQAVADAYNTAFMVYFMWQHHMFFDRLFSTDHIPMYVGISFFIWYFHKLLQGQRFKLQILFLLYVIVLSPLLLHLIAWDTSRIWTYPIFEILFFLYILKEWVVGKFEITDQYPLIQYGVIVLIIVNIFYSIPLMDNEVEKFSPLEKTFLYSPVILFMLRSLYKKNILSV